MTSPHSTVLVGKTVKCIEYDYDDALRLHFTDGSMLYVSGVWHNDSSAGTEVALIGSLDPKSYDESKRFYDLVHERRWDQ